MAVIKGIAIAVLVVVLGFYRLSGSGNGVQYLSKYPL